MKDRVRRSHLAGGDLLEVWLHLAERSELAADRFIDRLESTCSKLAASPGLGRSRDELAPGLRSFPVGRYVIFYRRSPDGIEIVRVLHGARDLDLLF